MNSVNQKNAVKMIDDGEAERLFKREFGDTVSVIGDGTKLIENYFTLWGDNKPF